MTKNVHISGSTQPFFTEQGPLDSQLDNKSYHQLIEVFSSGFKNAPESLPQVHSQQCATLKSWEWACMGMRLYI